MTDQMIQGSVLADVNSSIRETARSLQAQQDLVTAALSSVGETLISHFQAMNRTIPRPADYLTSIRQAEDQLRGLRESYRSAMRLMNHSVETSEQLRYATRSLVPDPSAFHLDTSPIPKHFLGQHAHLVESFGFIDESLAGQMEALHESMKRVASLGEFRPSLSQDTTALLDLLRMRAEELSEHAPSTSGGGSTGESPGTHVGDPGLSQWMSSRELRRVLWVLWFVLFPALEAWKAHNDRRTSGQSDERVQRVEEGQDEIKDSVSALLLMLTAHLEATSPAPQVVSPSHRLSRDLHLHERPDSGSPSVRPLPAATRVEVLFDGSSWVRVAYQAGDSVEVGWVYGKYVHTLDQEGEPIHRK